MSDKITKRMLMRVEDMVSQASSATQQQPEPDAKTRKTSARRALLEALSSQRSMKTRTTPVAVRRNRLTKARKGGKSSGTRLNLLEGARKELRGKSNAARNINLLTYARQQRSDGMGAKSQRAIEALLLRDQSARK